MYDFKISFVSLLMFTSFWWLMPTMDFTDLVLSALASYSVACIDGMMEFTYFPLCFSFGDVCADPVPSHPFLA